MLSRLKQIIGALIFDVPRYTYYLFCKSDHNGYAWMLVKNRHETLAVSEKFFAIKCLWKWTSDLYLPKVFPVFGRILFAKSLNGFSFDFSNKGKLDNKLPYPSVSFIIGHRGKARIPLLLKTLESIGAQKNCNIECIVVEQDTHQIVKSLLPEWVRYIHSCPENEDMPFSRAMAFNTGAQQATSNSIIFHDNDLLIPNDYALKTQELIEQGYDFINLKRFIFYLSEAASSQLLTQEKISEPLEIDSIMQNAEGGGSIGCSRNGYFKIGGFDERFIGWGGEDNEFWERASTCKIWEFGCMPLIHLWHGPQAEKKDIDNSDTKALYKKLSKLNPSDRIFWLNENQSSTKLVRNEEVQ